MEIYHFACIPISIFFYYNIYVKDNLLNDDLVFNCIHSVVYDKLFLTPKNQFFRHSTRVI